jgi:3-phosphoshikimate 1-carboxyvinyltransferase
MSQQVLIAQPLTAARSRGLSGRLRLPADRLIAPMALMLAAVARGDTILEGLADTPDVKAAIGGLKAMGVGIERGDGRHHIGGLGALGLLEPRSTLDFSAAATALWLTMGLVAPYSFDSRFSGSDLPSTVPPVEALRALGTDAQEQKSGHMPVTLRGPRTGVPFVHRLPTASIEVKAALLLAALALPGISTLVETAPTPDHPERLLDYFGGEIKSRPSTEGSRSIEITGLPRLGGQVIALAADPDLAAFPIVAALIVPGSDLLIENVLMHPLRTGLIEVLRQMGGDIEAVDPRLSGGEEVADLRVRHSRLTAATVRDDQIGAPAIAALAIAGAFAAGETVIGISRARFRAGDDVIPALAEGLVANGIAARRTGEALIVPGGDPTGKLGGGTVSVKGNGLVAMAFLVMGLSTGEAITIDDDRAIAGIYPDFRIALQARGADFFKRWAK